MPEAGARSWHLRPARRDEAERLGAIALRAKAHWGYDAAFLDACRDVLQVGPELFADNSVRVAEGESGELLGFGTIAALEGGRAEIDHLFVEPSAHGLGVGRALVAHLLELARQRGYICLEALSDPNARGFYESCGFRLAGHAPSDAIPGRDLPLLEYYLTVSATEPVS